MGAVSEPLGMDPFGKGSGFRDGIYYSKRPNVRIPKDPFLDYTTFSLDQPLVDSVALVDAPTGESITFRELKRRVYSLASGLADRGVKQGDVVMIVSPNSVHYPALVFAVAAIGAVVTTANPAYTTSEIGRQIRDSHTKFIATLPGLVERVASLKVPLILIDDGVGEGRGEANCVEKGGVILEIVAYLSELYKADPRRAPRVQIRQTDTAMLLYSSGTTGLSKGAILSHGNCISACCIHNEGFVYDEDRGQKSSIATVPFYHVFGMIVSMGNQLKVGNTLVVIPKFELPKFLAAIERYRVNHAPLVPPMLTAMMKSPLVSKYDLSSLENVGVGGAPCGAAILLAAAEQFRGSFLKKGYALTETTGLGTTTIPVPDAAEHYSSVGLLMANFEAKIVRLESGESLPPHQRGEIWLRGPSVMQGYLNNEKATAEAVDDEKWLHTGDIGYFDEDGYLFIVDRLKELIKYNGLQVAPAELEDILLSHPQILDAAVAGFPDEQTGEIPVAFIVRSKGSSLKEDDVMQFVAEKVARYKKVRKVVFVESIPKSPTGKILRRELKLPITSKL